MPITIVDLNTEKKKKKNPLKPANPSTSDVKQGHKRKGGGSKPHSSRGRIGTATIKKNVDAAARRANKRSEKAMRADNNILTELGNYITATGGVNSLAKKTAKKASVPKPKRKPPVPKVPLITGPKAKAARRPTMKEQRDAGASVMVDYEQLNKMAGGGMIGGQKKLDANKDGMISKVDFEMMGANKKQYGGKVSYKMAGGQVVANCYD